ncbi:hypothetical protein AHAS_Ahas16G0251100 [Arachis hypogaea]
MEIVPKTKCGLVIDFFGEKNVKVAGLDDISIDIDVIKDKSKIVEESVDAIRECSAEIELLEFSSQGNYGNLFIGDDLNYDCVGWLNCLLCLMN